MGIESKCKDKPSDPLKSNGVEGDNLGFEIGSTSVENRSTAHRTVTPTVLVTSNSLIPKSNFCILKDYLKSCFKFSSIFKTQVPVEKKTPITMAHMETHSPKMDLTTIDNKKEWKVRSASQI